MMNTEIYLELIFKIMLFWGHRRIVKLSDPFTPNLAIWAILAIF
jgi:hypothetical protein